MLPGCGGGPSGPDNERHPGQETRAQVGILSRSGEKGETNNAEPEALMVHSYLNYASEPTSARFQ
jgi:hypothetical protein